MSLLRKVLKEEKTKENKYGKYGFKYNPFPNKASISLFDPNPKNNGSIYVPDIRLSEIEQFEKILISSSRNPEPKSIAFLMDYATRKGRGIGKTSFLNYQRKTIQEDLGDRITDGKQVMMAVLVSPRPDENYKKFYSISKLIIESIIDQNLIQNASLRLKVFTELIDSRVVELAEKSDFANTIGKAQWLIENHKSVGADYDDNNVTQTVKSKLIRSGINSELATAVARFGHDTDLFRKFYFDKIQESTWKQEGNSLLFNDFVKLFEAAEITKFVILFDELEKVIPGQNAAERRNFCDVLRYYFIDGNCENTASSFYHILFVIHPYLQELLVPHWEASGLQRFAALGGELADHYTVFFESFDEKNSIPLAAAYIEDSLINPKSTSGLAPFTEAALKEALSRTLGVPGKYLSMLHTAIEKGIEKDWSTIGVDEIRAVEMAKVGRDDEEENDSPLSSPKTEI
jgi:hypothetical protein